MNSKTFEEDCDFLVRLLLDSMLHTKSWSDTVKVGSCLRKVLWEYKQHTEELEKICNEGGGTHV